MKVLIADFDLFAKVGGGQTFYRQVIKKNPQIDFYYLADKEKADSLRPQNATAIIFKEVYSLQDFTNFFDVDPPKWSHRTFVQASNIAASAQGWEFDIIDTPDYEQWGLFLAPALVYHQVKYQKIVLSMHGLISTTLRLDWFEKGTENVPLELQEKKQYETVDLRYGISQSYLDEWRAISSLTAYYYHPLYFFDLPKPTTAIPTTDPPTLNFIGRTEKRKGPDIFIDLVWWLPENYYNQASIIGPHSSDDTGMISSESFLRGMLQNRPEKVQLLPPKKPDELMLAFAHKSITFVPSRYDTLNLVALESLFAGCPTAIGSGAGVCRFLEETFPQVPFIKIDIDNIYACLPELFKVLEHYEDYRQNLVNVLLSTTPQIDDPDLDSIYKNVASSNPEIRQELELWYSRLMSYWRSLQEGFSLSNLPPLRSLRTHLKPRLKQLKRTLKQKKGELQAQLTQPLADARNFQALKSPLLLTKYKETFKFPEQSKRDLADKIQQCWRVGSEFESEFQGVRGKLSTNYRIDRVRLWREAARVEELRGNILVTATYKLRVMRALGGDNFGDLAFVLRTLEEKGFFREAKAVDALYGNSSQRDERCLNLIEAARVDNLTNSANDEYEIWDDRRDKSAYRASIIVSLYNAAEKLPLFLRTLQHQTLIQRGEAEVILVDSGSPGDEYEVWQQLAAELDYAILYVRSQQRETIQSAWNRGIELARSPYLSFLGVDETILPDCLEVLARELDRDSQLDWVIGHSLVTNVDSKGSWSNDVMVYDRTGYEQDLVYLETCYLSWVGALYRKSIHDRFGYYDATFRGAGDTEFKSRVMPFIKSKVVDRTLGVFWNYPEERTTQSPAAEIEDMRAWYLHRTLAGVKYAFDKRSPEEVENLLYHCLGYRKSYCKHTSTDLDYAYNLALYLQENYPQSPALQYFHGIKTLLESYRALDWMPKLSRFSPFSLMLETRKLAQQIQEEHLKYWNSDRNQQFQPTYQIFNDNRHEQHSFLWFTNILGVKK